MTPLFQRYSLFYEWLEYHLHGFFSSLPLLLCACTLLLAIGIPTAKQNKIRLIILSSAGVLIQGGFFIPEAQHLANVVYLRLLGLLLLIFYASMFGLTACSKKYKVRTLHGLAISGIIMLFAIKCTYLEQWPPVLTDYAASTGKNGIRLLQNFSLLKLFSGNKPWVSGGGQSIIHAPLLLINFKLFGYSTFAVRFAEVLYSTATLGILWLILSVTTVPLLAFGGVLLFGFSSEHLSFSRIGTFYSASQALGLLILLLWIQFSLQTHRRHALLLLLLICSLLVPFGYAPIKPVLLFSCLQALLLGQSKIFSIASIHRSKRLVITAALAIIILGYFLKLILADPNLFYSSKAPSLPPTDIPIWHKGENQIATRNLQPPLIILNNLYDNVLVLLQESICDVPFGSHPLLAFSTFLLFSLSLIGLFSNKTRLPSTFLLLAFAPQLLVYPLARRGILYRPFIPLCFLLFIYEYWTSLASVIRRRWILTMFTVPLLVGVATLPARELYFFTKFNGPVGVGPSFGPEYVQFMLDHLKKLDKSIPLVIINANYSADKYRMALSDRIYRDRANSAPVHFIEINQRSTIKDIPRADGPLYIGVLNEDYRRDVIPWLLKNIPGIEINSYGDNNTVFYWIGKVGT